MRIVAAELGRYGHEVALGPRGGALRRDGLLLRLHDDQRHIGLGEASPLPGYSPDTLDECEAALRDIAARLPAFDLDQHPITVVAKALEMTGVRPPAARFALETALLDLAGGALGRPLHALLGPAAQAVPLAALIAGETAEEACAGARHARERGITTFKRKIGRADFARELELLAALRRELGGAAPLRLDCNRAFSLTEAPARLAALAAFDPEFVEEPVASGELARLGRAPVPLAVDETLQSPSALIELEPLLRAGAVTVVVLKPMALGGLLRCQALARRARELGARAVVTHLFDGPVALAAAAALAVTLPRPLACGLDPHPGLDAWPPARLDFLSAGKVVPLDRPGLGVELPSP